jgi:endonuclease/exonuclease/phosphatase family metal-dependent hydrolase
VRTTLVSWNLKGSANPDVAGIVDHLRAQGADVVGLQEVQWHQARRIARALGARSRRWGFKHWPGRTWPEGMAVIGVTRRVHVRTRALSHRWRLWSWRRRIVQVATVEAAGDGHDGGGDGLALVNVHLTPHGEVELRGVETSTVLALVAQRTGPIVVSGDFNERPGGPIHRQLAAAGLRDGWGEPQADGSPAEGGGRPPDPWPTNWRGWRRGTDKSPTQQLDYVYVSPTVHVVELSAPRPGDEGFGRFARLSDHLPVTAVLDVGSAGGRHP